MRLLIDAHALLWAVDDPAQLSSSATTALQEALLLEALRKEWPQMNTDEHG
jgi:PIN domain nuclease of toxin-antitoxin system